MVKTEAGGEGIRKSSLKVKLGGKGAAKKESADSSAKLKVKLPAASEDPEYSEDEAIDLADSDISDAEEEMQPKNRPAKKPKRQPAKKTKRARTPDEVRVLITLDRPHSAETPSARASGNRSVRRRVFLFDCCGVDQSDAMNGRLTNKISDRLHDSAHAASAALKSTGKFGRWGLRIISQDGSIHDYMMAGNYPDVHDVQKIPVGAEIEGIGADDLEELSEDENEYYKLGAEDEEFKDYKSLGLKLDHANRYRGPSLLKQNAHDISLWPEAHLLVTPGYPCLKDTAENCWHSFSSAQVLWARAGSLD